MSVAKVIEISAESPESFDAAIKEGIKRAGTSVEDVRGAWVNEQSVVVEGGKIKAYRVNLKVTFVLKS